MPDEEQKKDQVETNPFRFAHPPPIPPRVYFDIENTSDYDSVDLSDRQDDDDHVFDVDSRPPSPSSL
jgi:hypothetical protein